MPVLLRVTMILTFIVSLAAGMSAGKIYAQYGDQSGDSAGRTLLKLETAAVQSTFPESEDMLRQMANEMIKSQSLQDIEPASGIEPVQ